MTENHYKEFFVLFAAFLGADKKKKKKASYFNNQHSDEKDSKTKRAEASIDVNEVTPQTTSAAGYGIIHRMKQMLEEKRNRQMKRATERERGKEIEK